MVVLVALELLGSTQKTEHNADVRNPGLVPLGTPLLAGPGAIALVWITTAPEIAGMVEGWDPQARQGVLDRLARKLVSGEPPVAAKAVCSRAVCPRWVTRTAGGEAV